MQNKVSMLKLPAGIAPDVVPVGAGVGAGVELSTIVGEFTVLTVGTVILE